MEAATHNYKHEPFDFRPPVSLIDWLAGWLDGWPAPVRSNQSDMCGVCVCVCVEQISYFSRFVKITQTTTKATSRSLSFFLESREFEFEMLSAILVSYSSEMLIARIICLATTSLLFTLVKYTNQHK